MPFAGKLFAVFFRDTAGAIAIFRGFLIFTFDTGRLLFDGLALLDQLAGEKHRAADEE